MRGTRAIAAIAGAVVATLTAASAVSYAVQASRAGGPDSVGDWARGAVRPPGPIPAGRGEALFQELGCRLCHTLDGRGGRVGPVLNGVRARKTRMEIIEWLDDPQRIKPGTKMPTFHLAPVEEQLLADYLMTR